MKKKKRGAKPKVVRYAEFTERGYCFKAYINYGAPPRFVLRIFNAKTGKLIQKEELPPFGYECRFGVDVADKAALEARTEEILRKLPKLGRR